MVGNETAGVATVPAVEIRERLRLIRDNRSQRQVSEDVGLSQNTWSRYENEGRLPEWETLQILVDKGWNAHWLLKGEGPARGATGPNGETFATPLQALQRPAMDLQRLTDAIEAVETGLDATNQMMEPPDKAGLVAAVYELLAEQGSTIKIFKLITKGKL